MPLSKSSGTSPSRELPEWPAMKKAPWRQAAPNPAFIPLVSPPQRKVNQCWKKPSDTQIIVVDDSQGWKKQRQTDDESGLTCHDERPMETQIDDDTDTPTELEESDNDSVFAELTHGAPPPPRARISSTELVETMAAGAEALAIAEFTHLKPMDVKAVFAAEGLNKKNISEPTQIKPMDAFDAYDFCKNLAEPTQFKPSPQLAVMVDQLERDMDLAKKISESTQIKPNDVRAVLTAMHTIAYNDLKRQAKFVMLGVHLKLRNTLREHRRWVITGKIKVVMKAMAVET